MIDWPEIRQVRLYFDQVAARFPLFSLNIPTFAYFCELTLRNRHRIVLVSGLKGREAEEFPRLVETV